jgi:SpoVK/Ycf46/Vps4 family AAA+-type ATPase
MWIRREKMEISKIPFPRFLEELKIKYEANESHVFILHFNIRDRVPMDGYPHLSEYLPQFLREVLAVNQVFFYSVTRSEEIRRLIDKSASAGNKEDGLIRQIREEREGNITPERVLAVIERELRKKDAKKAFILDFAENLFPAKPCDNSTITRAEYILRWALDEEIADAGNLVVLLTRTEKELDNRFLDDASRISRILVPFPDRNERLMYIEHLISENGCKLKDGLDNAMLANLTTGLRLWDLEDIFLEATVRKEKISGETINAKKKKLIESQSQGMLKVLQSDRGFEAVGGLTHIVNYLKGVVEAMKRGDRKEAIAGMLFVGPPGTGKTLLAKALAKEAGFNCVQIKDVREMWVGASERNLSLVLNIISALAPVVVFMDELDQGEGSRGNNLDSGVSKRIFGTLLEAMSDETLRGKVLWVAASNRPDLIDEAMKRAGRFDVKVLFLWPSKHEREDIFRKMFHENHKIPFSEDIDFARMAERTDGLSGAEIEYIVTQSYRFATRKSRVVTSEDLISAINDYIPSRNDEMVEYMTFLGLLEVNSKEMLPNPLPSLLEQFVNPETKDIDKIKVKERVKELEKRLFKSWVY